MMAWHPTLDDMERRQPEWTPGWRKRIMPARELLLVGSADCWCGEKYQHDWPGKASGAPHPRRLPS